MDTSCFRGVYVPYCGHPKFFVLPPPIWWQFQPVNCVQYSPEEAFYHGSIWPMLVDGFSREEGIS